MPDSYLAAGPGLRWKQFETGLKQVACDIDNYCHLQIIRQRIRRCFLLLGMGFLYLWIGRATPCLAQEMFKVDEISRFDGKTWGGLTIGDSTTADIKKLFKTSKGAVRPEAMLLPQPQNSPVRVDVLMIGRGANSVLSGFRLAYTDGGTDLKTLSESLKLEPETWYPREHFDDWRVEAFPERGIVAFMEGSGRTERTSVVLLCAPFHVRDVIASCEHQPTRPLNILDVYPDDKRVLEIGNVSVDIDCGKGIKVDKSDEVARNLEKQIWRNRTPREIDIHSGATGSLTVKFDISFNAKDSKATVSATANMSGTTLLGRVSTSTQSTDTYREDSLSPVWYGSSRLERIMYDVLDKAFGQMADKVRKQPLPTPAALRLQSWDTMINQGTSK